MTMKALFVALGLAMTTAAMAPAQVIGGEVKMQSGGTRDDVTVIAGELDLTGTVEGDVTGIAGDVDIDADVTGSIELIGGDISIAGSVRGEVDVAGGDITISADVDGDVNAAGGDLDFSGSSGGDIALAGGSVRLREAARVAGEADVAAGEIYALGQIGDTAEFEAREVHLGGQFSGSVEVTAEHVYVLETARIDGELRVRGPNEPEVEDGAVVTGGVDFIYEPFDFGVKHFDGIDTAVGNFFGILGLAFLIPAFVVGLLTLLFFPNGMASMSRHFRRRWALGSFFGFIGFAFAPVAFLVIPILLMVTVIGIPLALLIWVLMPPFYFLVMAFGAIILGTLLFQRDVDGPIGMGKLMLGLLVVMALMAGLSFVPFLGALVSTLVMFVGFGGIFMAFAARGQAKSGDFNTPHAATSGKTDPDAGALPSEG